MLELQEHDLPASEQKATNRRYIQYTDAAIHALILRTRHLARTPPSLLISAARMIAGRSCSPISEFYLSFLFPSFLEYPSKEKRIKISRAGRYAICPQATDT
jgi:hypothetical protein